MSADIEMADPMIESPDAERLPLSRLIAVLLLASIGQIPPYATPFTLGALVEGYALSTQAASVAISVEVGCLALGVMLTSRLLHRLDFRMAAVAGIVVALIGQFITVFALSYSTLIFARALAGIGGGCGIAIAYAVISRSPSPTRFFTIQSIVLGVLVLAIFMFLPEIEASSGRRAQFYLLGLTSAIALPFALTLRNVRVPEEHMDLSVSRKSSLWWIIIACVSVFGTAANATWLHYEHFGELLGFSFRQLVTLSTICGMLMVVAPLLALKIFERTKNFTPLAIGCVAQAAAVAAYFTIPSTIIFVGCVILLNLIICIMLVYVRMLSADLDTSGKMAAAAGGGDFLGSFAGPLLGGLFTISIGGNGYFIVTLGLFFIAGAALCMVGTRYTSRA